MNFIHIGLGKTATTSLQRHVFPRIGEFIPTVTYNDRYLIRQLLRFSLFDPTPAQCDAIRARLASGNHLISFETLVDWNPRNWKHAADRNLRLFGPDNHIVITARRTRPYLTSIYQQMIHEGNVQPPQNFFLRADEYTAISRTVPGSSLKYFDVDSFRLKDLYDLYRDRFTRVSMVPMNEIENMRFLSDDFDLSESQVEQLRTDFRNASRQNRSYSALAMRLTLAREDWLALRRLKTRGSHDVSEIEIYRKYLSDDESAGGFVPSLGRSSQLPHSGSVRSARQRIRRKLMKTNIWRLLMQGVVNRALPYRKYQLPDDCYRNEELERENDEFIVSFAR